MRKIATMTTLLAAVAFTAVSLTQNASAGPRTGHYWIQNGCWARDTDGTFTRAKAHKCPTKMTAQMRAAYPPMDEMSEIMVFGVLLPLVSGAVIIDPASKRADYSRPVKGSR